VNDATAGAGNQSCLLDRVRSLAQVRFTGTQFLHGFIQHRFSGESMPSLQLAARARQFSSFILMVGTIGRREGE